METKKLYNMNYLKGLHPKGSNELRMRTTKNGLRGLILRGVALLAMLLGGMTAMAQTQYVFMRNNGSNIYYANNATWSNNTTFNKSYVWTLEDGVPINNGRYLIITRGNGNYGAYTYTASLSTTKNTTYTFSISNNNVLSTTQRGNQYYGGNNTYYLPYNSFSLATNTSENNRVIAYQVTSLSAQYPTLDISVNPEIASGGIKLNSVITGNYAPACSTVTLGSNTYYWTNTTEASTTRPGLVDDWSDATITWAVTTGGTYASVSSEGLVTLTANPTGNVVVRMTVTKGASPATTPPLSP